MWFINTNAYIDQLQNSVLISAHLSATSGQQVVSRKGGHMRTPVSTPSLDHSTMDRLYRGIYICIGIEGYITSPLSLPCMYMHVHVLTLHVTYILGFSHKINFLKINSHVISSHEINFHKINKALQNSC